MYASWLVIVILCSDFSPTANALVSLIPAPPCQWPQEWLRAGSYSWSLPTGHWLLGLNCAHMGPGGGNPSCLLPGVRGPHWQHQLLMLLSIWPLGKSSYLGLQAGPYLLPDPRVQAIVQFTELRGVYSGI